MMLDNKRGAYAVVCICTEVGAPYPMDRFCVGWYDTPQEAVRARILHQMWHEQRFGDLGQQYEIPLHPDWRYSEQGRIQHAQYICHLQDELAEAVALLNM